MLNSFSVLSVFIAGFKLSFSKLVPASQGKLLILMPNPASRDESVSRMHLVVFSSITLMSMHPVLMHFAIKGYRVTTFLLPIHADYKDGYVREIWYTYQKPE